MPAPHHPSLSSNQLLELQWQQGFNHKLYFALKMGRIGFAWLSWQHTHCHDPMGSLCKSIFFTSCPYTARRSMSVTLLCDLLVGQFLNFLQSKSKRKRNICICICQHPERWMRVRGCEGTSTVVMVSTRLVFEAVYLLPIPVPLHTCVS